MDENQNQTVALSEREKELVEKIANLEQDKANLVGEIQDTRATKTAREKELQDLKKALEDEGKSTDPDEAVERVLAKKAEKESATNFELAKTAFKEQVKEFSDDVDAGGILFSKFEKEMKKFNFTDLKSKEDYIGRLKEVYEFTQRERKAANPSIEFYKGSPANIGADAKETDRVSLTTVESALVAEMGITKDKFLAIKAKRPHYVANLLKYRSV